MSRFFNKPSSEAKPPAGSSFLSRLDSPLKSPSLSGESTLVRVESGGLASLPTSVGLVVVFVAKVEDVCGGLIGTSGVKFCMRTDCGTASHRTKKAPIKKGVYLKGSNEEEGYTSPCVDITKLT